MNLHIPPQKAFLYQGKWIREMDTLLLSTMVNMRGGREWGDECGSEEVLRILRGVINPPFGAGLSTDDISIQVKFMNAWFLTFKKVVKTNGAYWNMKDKIVSADEPTWKLIFQARLHYFVNILLFSKFAELYCKILKLNLLHNLILLQSVNRCPVFLF